LTAVGEPVIADDGCRLWTERRGRGVPLMLLHGGPGLWDYFDGVAEEFRDFADTVRWDQRGCGRSTRTGPYTIDRFVRDVDAVRAHCGFDRIALFGHSWGAYLALRYARAFPDRVSTLIYVSGVGVDPTETWRPAFHASGSPGSDPITSDPITSDPINSDPINSDPISSTDRVGERERAIREWSMDFVDPATARANAERMATPWFDINTECAASLNAEFDAYARTGTRAPEYADLAVPVWIVDGARDRRPRSAVDSLERALPDVRRVTIDTAGHNPWADEPDVFRDLIRTALTEPLA
jgi:proline iminopeptidase